MSTKRFLFTESEVQRILFNHWYNVYKRVERRKDDAFPSLFYGQLGTYAIWLLILHGLNLLQIDALAILEPTMLPMTMIGGILYWIVRRRNASFPKTEKEKELLQWLYPDPDEAR